jgi:hypothetical protein
MISRGQSKSFLRGRLGAVVGVLVAMAHSDVPHVVFDEELVGIERRLFGNCKRST